MIETIFIAMWFVIFGLVCLTIKQALQQRSRDSRRHEIRSYRRFLGYQESSRRKHRRQGAVLQPAAA